MSFSNSGRGQEQTTPENDMLTCILISLIGIGAFILPYKAKVCWSLWLTNGKPELHVFPPLLASGGKRIFEHYCEHNFQQTTTPRTTYQCLEYFLEGQKPFCKIKNKLSLGA